MPQWQKGESGNHRRVDRAGAKLSRSARSAANVYNSPRVLERNACEQFRRRSRALVFEFRVLRH
jgi:hypothetical protein